MVGIPGINVFSVVSCPPHRDLRLRLRSSLDSLDSDSLLRPESPLLFILPFKAALMLLITSMLGFLRTGSSKGSMTGGGPIPDFLQRSKQSF